MATKLTQQRRQQQQQQQANTESYMTYNRHIRPYFSILTTSTQLVEITFYFHFIHLKQEMF